MRLIISLFYKTKTKLKIKYAYVAMSRQLIAVFSPFLLFTIWYSLSRNTAYDALLVFISSSYFYGSELQGCKPLQIVSLQGLRSEKEGYRMFVGLVG